MDYAERWPRALLDDLLRDRVLHGAFAGEGVVGLSSGGAVVDFLANELDRSGISAQRREVGWLGREIDRGVLCRRVRQVHRDPHDQGAGARAGGVAAVEVGVRPGFEQVLAALAAVHARLEQRDPPSDPAAVSAYLLDREQEHWRKLLTRAHPREHHPSRTSPEMMRRPVVTATLTGPLPWDLAGQVLQRAQLVNGPPTSTRC